MFKRLVYLLLFSIIPLFPVRGEGSRLNLYLELDQMLSVKIGVEYNFPEDWGIRGSFGTAPFGLTTFTYSFLGVYHLSHPDNLWQFDLEWGLLLAYFNFLEGEYVDWDPAINGPFHGYLPGVSMKIGYRTAIGLWSLRLGGGLWMEHQRDTGWKGPNIMPIVSLIYDL